MSSIINTRRTYFGIASLIVALISMLFLAGSFVITVINISPATFGRLNNLTYSVYCITTPLSFVLGALSFTKKNDFTLFSVIAMGIVVLPFLFFLTQLISFFLP